jgi:hypothetical protein
MVMCLDTAGRCAPALAHAAGLGYVALVSLPLPMAAPALGVLTVYLASSSPPLVAVLPRLRARRADYGALATRKLLACGPAS